METKRYPVLLVGTPAKRYGLTLHTVLACACTAGWRSCPGMDDMLEVHYVDGEFRLRYKPGLPKAHQFQCHPDAPFKDPNWPNPDDPLALPEMGPDPELLSVETVDDCPTVTLSKAWWFVAHNGGCADATFLSLEDLDDPRFSHVVRNWFGDRDLYGFWHP